jgi:hypothetical protein
MQKASPEPGLSAEIGASYAAEEQEAVLACRPVNPIFSQQSINVISNYAEQFVFATRQRSSRKLSSPVDQSTHFCQQSINVIPQLY